MSETNSNEANITEEKLGSVRHTSDPNNLKSHPLADSLLNLSSRDLSQLKKNHIGLSHPTGLDNSRIRDLEKELHKIDPSFLQNSTAKQEELSQKEIDDLPKHIREQVEGEQKRIEEQAGPQQDQGEGGRHEELKAKPDADLTPEERKELKDFEAQSNSGGGGFGINLPGMSIGNPLKAFGKDSGPKITETRPIANEVLANNAIANELVAEIQKATKLNDYATDKVASRLDELGIDGDQFTQEQDVFLNHHRQYNEKMDKYRKLSEAEKIKAELPTPPTPSPTMQKAMGDTQLTDAMKTMESTQKNLADKLDPSRLQPLQKAVENGTISKNMLDKVQDSLRDGANSIENSIGKPHLGQQSSMSDEPGYLEKLQEFMQNLSFSLKLPSFSLGGGGNAPAPSA